MTRRLPPRFADGPHARRVWAAGRLFAALAALGMLMLAAGAAEADRRQYTLDDDPLRLANKALQDGDLVAAREHFAEAVANDHRLPEALCGLARVDLSQGLLAEAEAHSRQALAAAGGRLPAARAILGLALLRQGRAGEADPEFAQALQEDPGLWEAHYGQARSLMEAGRWDAAKAHLDIGGDRRGQDQGEDLYQYGLALWLQGTGDLPGAERAALKARHLNPGDPAYGLLLARVYEEGGYTALAIPAYEEALAVPGVQPAAPLLHGLGRLYAGQNRFNEAGERYLQALAADSTYTPALADLADLFRRAKQYDKAAGTYLRLAALRPQDLSVQLGLAEVLQEAGRTEESLQAARAALGLAPQDEAARFAFARAGLCARDDSTRAEAAALMAALPAALPWRAGDLVDLAAWQAERGQYAAADSTLARAALRDPALARVPFQQGLVALRQGQPAAAADAFARAVALEPEVAANHLNLGIARYQMGDVPGALLDFRRAVELRADLTAARLLLAQALAATNALTEAEREYRVVLESEPQNAKALRGVGFCSLRRADYRGAAAAYASAAAAEPKNADNWAGLGSARLGLGELDAAEAAFAKARAIDPGNAMLKTGSDLLNQAKSAGKEN